MCNLVLASKQQESESIVKLLKNLFALIQMLKLFVDPPALFHYLYSLDWYRETLFAALPNFQDGWKGKSVLEIGCATGDFCRDMSAMGAIVCGVDRSGDMVRNATLAYENIRFEVADAMSLPLSKQQFEVVFAASLLNVVKNPVEVLREMLRVCRLGGVLVLLVPAAEFSTTEAKRWLMMQKFSAKNAIAYMAWYRLAKKVKIAQFTQWISEAGGTNMRVESRCLLGGMVRVFHVYPS